MLTCLFVIVAAHPAAPQTRGRLDLEIESWLDPTPSEASKEFTAKFNEAAIEVSDDLDAPVLSTFRYEEAGAPGIWAKLVPGTHDFPSAAELRVRAIDDFDSTKAFGYKSLATITKDFLQKNLAAIQAAASRSPIASPLLAILLLEDYGEASARQMLTDHTAHPLYGTSALKSLRAINTRNP